MTFITNRVSTTVIQKFKFPNINELNKILKKNHLIKACNTKLSNYSQYHNTYSISSHLVTSIVKTNDIIPSIGRQKGTAVPLDYTYKGTNKTLDSQLELNNSVILHGGPCKMSYCR